MDVQTDLVSRLGSALGARSVLSGADAASFVIGWPVSKPCIARVIVRPSTTEQLSAAVRICTEHRIPIVALGGGTGLVDGVAQSPDEALFDLSRMNVIEVIDAEQRCVIVQAGVPLQVVQEAAAAQGLYFPVDLGARGSATIGGMIATNAGGNRVLRFGMMRDNVLGIEAVLADGQVMTSLNRMLKNNAGYDLKHLFVGTEGTLGIVSRACLRLRVAVDGRGTALLCLERFEDVVRLLNHVGRRLDGALSAFEVMWPLFYAAAAGQGAPLAPNGKFFVLVEALFDKGEALREGFEQCLMDAIEADIACDGVIAKSEAEIDRIWAIRDGVDRLTKDGPVVMFDVSVPIPHMQAYCARLESAFAEAWPNRPVYIWGHLADSNLHVWASLGDAEETTKRAAERIVYGALEPFGGSISGEHGIGLEKRDYLGVSRSPIEIALMRRLKHCLDPEGLLNPGKVFSA